MSTFQTSSNEPYGITTSSTTGSTHYVRIDPITEDRDDYTPEWLVKVGEGSYQAIALDDGCFIVLNDKDGYWKTTNHIHPRTVSRMARLVEEGHGRMSA